MADRPAAPHQLAYTALSATSVRLSWSGPADVDKYVVRVGADRALTVGVTSVNATSTTAIVRGLPAASPGVDHYFRVDAYRDHEVTASRVGTFSLAPGPLAAVKLADLSAKAVRLRLPATTNTRHYDVVIARDQDFSERVLAGRTLGAEHTFTAGSLAPGKRYFVKARAVNGATLGPFSASLAFTTPPDAKTFTIGTWNVCSEKCRGYAGRARIGAAFFNAEGIDIFGLQEAGGVRVGRTTNAIWSGGSQGFVRATGGAKGRYIFYRPALFDQVAGGTFGIGDGRDATWAHLSIRGADQEFLYVDIHLENGHGNDAKREREMNAVLANLARINSARLPIVYAGDFNSGKHRSKNSPGRLMQSAGLADAFDLTTSDPVNARYNSGHTLSTKLLTSGALIDHIFLSREFTVSSWEQLVRISNGRYRTPMVSDHNALKATVTLRFGRPDDLGAPTPTTAIPGPALATMTR